MMSYTNSFKALPENSGYKSSLSIAVSNIVFSSSFTLPLAKMNSMAFCDSWNISLFPIPLFLEIKKNVKASIFSIRFTVSHPRKILHLPNADAARPYSADRLVEKTPQSSVHKIKGWFDLYKSAASRIMLLLTDIQMFSSFKDHQSWN